MWEEKIGCTLQNENYHSWHILETQKYTQHIQTMTTSFRDGMLSTLNCRTLTKSIRHNVE